MAVPEGEPLPIDGAHGARPRVLGALGQLRDVVSHLAGLVGLAVVEDAADVLGELLELWHYQGVAEDLRQDGQVVVHQGAKGAEVQLKVLYGDPALAHLAPEVAQPEEERAEPRVRVADARLADGVRDLAHLEGLGARVAVRVVDGPGDAALALLAHVGRPVRHHAAVAAAVAVAVVVRAGAGGGDAAEEVVACLVRGGPGRLWPRSREDPAEEHALRGGEGRGPRGRQEGAQHKGTIQGALHWTVEWTSPWTVGHDFFMTKSI